MWHIGQLWGVIGQVHIYIGQFWGVIGQFHIYIGQCHNSTTRFEVFQIQLEKEGIPKHKMELMK